jgi:hypothetical protein
MGWNLRRGRGAGKRKQKAESRKQKLLEGSGFRVQVLPNDQDLDP